MSNQWFRLYSEIRNDPKLLIMPEALRWRYVTLLCLHNDGMYENTPNDEIALSLRVTVKEWEETIEEFIKRRLIDKGGKIIGWDKRQYLSDKKDRTAAERQKRYRDNRRNDRNDAVTSRPPEQIQNRTDTEQREIGKPENPAANPPSSEKSKNKKQASRLSEDFIPPDDWLEFARSKSLSPEEAGTEWGKFRDHHLSKATLLADWDAGWRTWVRRSVDYKMQKQQRETRTWQ